jgi:hypothetical protein
VKGQIEAGQAIALRIAKGFEEKEFSGVVESRDCGRGLVGLRIDAHAGMGPLPGEEATIIGKAAGADIDIPCVVADASRFPFLVCQEVDRRNHLRVNALLHVTYRSVQRALYEADPEGLLHRVREEMGGSENSFQLLRDDAHAVDPDPKFLCLLEEMNRKLDRILFLLNGRGAGGPEGVLPVNISGSGIRFTIRERAEARALFAVRIEIPGSPPAAIVFLGEVVRVRDKGNGQYETALKYVAIDELDREKIVHYVFRRMRESIRESRGKEKEA